MIRFDDWLIHADGDIIARQFDNLTRTLTVTGDIPTGWEWAMLVQVGEAMDVLPLTATENGLCIVLTASQVSISGYYKMQLRGTQGELVKHTNTIIADIPPSLSGDTHWPTLPSEFSAMEQRVGEAVDKAMASAGNAKASADSAAMFAAKAGGYTSHPPVIGENGNWMEWNGEAYVDTGKPSRGEDAATKIVATHDGKGNVVLSTESGQAITAAHDGKGNVVLSIGG